jgi:hypothetical protein
MGDFCGYCCWEHGVEDDCPSLGLCGVNKPGDYDEREIPDTQDLDEPDHPYSTAPEFAACANDTVDPPISPALSSRRGSVDAANDSRVRDAVSRAIPDSSREQRAALSDIPLEPHKKLLAEIFPAGHRELNRQIEAYRRENEGKRDRTTASVADWSRLHTIASLGDYTSTVGRSGWSGYWLFEFKGTKRVVLECPFTNNATYVLFEGWEKLIGRSKVDLRQQFAGRYYRLLHTSEKSWVTRLKGALKLRRRFQVANRQSRWQR